MSTSNDMKTTSSTSNANSTSGRLAPIVVKPPPADANIPSVPEGTEPTNGTDYRGLVPKKTELAVLGDAVSELENSAGFSALFGRSMPPVAYIIQVLAAANEWSTMRKKTEAWDRFSRTQEGLTWVSTRALMARMRPVFDTTAGTNADVAAQFPALGAFLGAARVIAKRGAATRKENAKRKAEREALARGAMTTDVREEVPAVEDP